MRRVVYLAVVALVAMMILVPAAGAQQDYAKEEMPKTGGLAIESMFLPAAVLLVGSGVLAYAVLRRR